MNNRSRVRERQWERDMVSKEWGLRVGEREREKVKGMVRIRLWLAHNNCGEKASLLNEAAAPPRPHTPTPTIGPPLSRPFLQRLFRTQEKLPCALNGWPSIAPTNSLPLFRMVSLSLSLSLSFSLSLSSTHFCLAKKLKADNVDVDDDEDCERVFFTVQFGGESCGGLCCCCCCCYCRCWWCSSRRPKKKKKKQSCSMRTDWKWKRVHQRPEMSSSVVRWKIILEWEEKVENCLLTNFITSGRPVGSLFLCVSRWLE